ncbi:MAG: DNA topoisomerase 1 [Chlamydiia bacterium]|nr:DNA topoisomerase 1 [Chlamydiia bacterium]
MSKSLIIVESPTKIKTLKKFLKGNFRIASSVGHIRDLPKKGIGIDFENNFEPTYEPMADKKEVISQLKKAAKECDVVYLAPDPDREGEAIAWHIKELLPPGTKCKRITFNELTKGVVNKALENPREIDLSLVNAQQARRILDRIVGYKISPILQRRVKRSGTGSLSAGRVQSVALRLIVEREREIEAFIPTEYWLLGSNLQADKAFDANLYSVDGLRVEKEKTSKKEVFTINNELTAKEIEDRLKKATYQVEKVEKKEKKRYPVPPFITSTLQQETSRHHGFSATRTMSVAQKLYEGIEVGNDGPEGLITYMRTDSVRISPEAQKEARGVIADLYGDEYLPPKSPHYATKKGAQDAHEAIRPTNLSHTPDSIRHFLDADQFKVYSLIWKRFFASQMKPAIYDTVSADIATNDGLILRSTGSVMKFKGFMAVYHEKTDDETPVNDSDRLLPPLVEKQSLDLNHTFANQSFTKPPARYTEASLVKDLEKLGIGRPSTYSSIMQKIQSRDYTTKERNTLIPTELGKIITQMLETSFPHIVDVKFTANMEHGLDDLAEQGTDWQEFIAKFWADFEPQVEVAEKEAHVPRIETNLDCPKCGHKLQKIWARNKYFYGCSQYPDCDYTAPLEELVIDKDEYAEGFDWEQKCSKCGSDMTVRKSRFGLFLGCSGYPKCKTIINIPKKDEPLPEDLPKCPAVGCDGDIVARRSRFGKTFFSCNNFPECDVIANSPEELLEKFANHPKTPAKTRGAKKAKAAKKKATTKKATKQTAKKAAKKATTRKAPVQKPVALSVEMQAVVKKDKLTRPEITKGIWDYIKENNLQDPKNKRMIIPDETLGKVFGSNEPIGMMQIAKHISKHIVS